MDAIATTLTAIREVLHPGERAGAIRSTAPASELACPICSETGWCRVQDEDFLGFRRCECVKARVKASKLAVIPELFRNASFGSHHPRNQRQERALELMRSDIAGSFYLSGSYGCGKTHLLYAQYRELVHSGRSRCPVRTTRDLVGELRRAELDDSFVSPLMEFANAREPFHLFWDDIDKLKITDFKTEVLFDLVDSLYRQKNGLTVTGNYSMRDLVERERMHPAIVRRLDDMCGIIEI